MNVDGVEIGDEFTKKVMSKLVEEGRCKTFSEAVAYLARLGASNTPKFLYQYIGV